MVKPKEKLTIDRLERALDILADIIIGEGEDGQQLLPLYRRLKEELREMKEERDLMEEIMARAARHKEIRTSHGGKTHKG